MDMRRRKELLPPSHFALPTPVKFQQQQQPRGAPTRGPPPLRPRTLLPGARHAEETRIHDSSSSFVGRSPASSSSSGPWTREDNSSPLSGHLQPSDVHHVADLPPAAADQLYGESPSLHETTSTPLQYGYYTARRGEEDEEEPEWPLKEAGARGIYHQRDSEYHTHAPTHNRSSARYPTGPGTVKSYSTACREVLWPVEPMDNTEEMVARSLARCQKIDKSLEFYKELREKWESPPTSPSFSQSVLPSRPTQSYNPPDTLGLSTKAVSGECASNTAACGSHPAPPSINPAIASAVGHALTPQTEPCKAPAGRTRSYSASGVPKIREERKKYRENQPLGNEIVSGKETRRSALNDLGIVPPGRKWTRLTTSSSSARQTPVITFAGPPSERTITPSVETSLGNELHMRALAPATAERSSLPDISPRSQLRSEPAKQKRNVFSTPTSPQWRVSQTPSTAVCGREKDDFNDFDSDSESFEPTGYSALALSTSPSQEASNTLSAFPSREKEEESEFNNFDSVHEISDSESTQQNVLSLPTSLSQEISKVLSAAHSREKEEDFNDFDTVQENSDSESAEPLSEVFRESVLTGAQTLVSPITPTDISGQLELAVTSLQSTCELDCAVREKPLPISTTRNDTVLARVLQAEEESRAGAFLTPNTSNDLAIARQIQNDFDQLTLTEDYSSSSGAQGTGPANSADFDGFHLIGQRPHHYGTSRAVSSPNSVGQDQRQRGSVSHNVADMARGDVISEREERAPEAAYGVDEDEAVGINSEMLEMISHLYVYKDKHRPKDLSVKPTSQCAVCLDDFHVGDSLRLMPCSHTFHRICVDTWLVKNDNCPVCKTDVYELAQKMGLTLTQERGQQW